MSDVFVTCFWCTDPLRARYAQEFVNRHPNVTLLTNNDLIKTENKVVYDFPDTGFIDYKMINEFIKGKDINTLTLMDSDIIVEPTFFSKMIQKHKESKAGLITIDTSHQFYNGEIFDKVESLIKNGRYGRTGYVLSFKKKVLEIGLSDKFIHGGYDYLLTCSVINKQDQAFKKGNLLKEFKKFQSLGGDYINSTVFHQCHSIRDNQITPWHFYV